jgi:FkbM family methyltransferase
MSWRLRGYQWLLRTLSPVANVLRSIPGFKGLHRQIVRFVRKSGVETANVSGVRLKVRSDDLVGFNILTSSGWEVGATKLFCDVIEPGMSVADVGANVGVYAILAARSTLTGKVLAFEPDPTNFSLLQDNILANQMHNITAFQIALSDSTGVTTLWLNPGSNRGKHSLSRANAASDDPVADSEVRGVQVKTDTLDSIVRDAGLEGLDVLKIDVEGGEPLVLRGATQTLANPRLTALFMELWPKGIERVGDDAYSTLVHLREHGFGFHVIERRSGELSPIEVRDAIDMANNSPVQHVDLLCRR